MSKLSALLRDGRFAMGLLRKRPFDCLIQVTNRCNMKCSFCDFWPNAAPRRDELTVADYQRLSGELKRLGCSVVSIEGGEPLVRPDVVEIVRAFADDHLPALFTNGWYVTADKARALFEAGLLHATVSIDYPDAARHDAKRRLEGAYERCWKALDHFLAVAPRGAKQVHVMTILMEDNWRDLEPLLQLTQSRGVGHQLSLLSLNGKNRGSAGSDRMPPAEVAAAMLDLWKRYPHIQFFRDYFAKIEPYLDGGPMPTCRAGVQSMNIDHVGNVGACIERSHISYGNVKNEPLSQIHRRMATDRAEVSRCQDCWTICRGFSQSLSNGGSLPAWWDLLTRMRSS